MAEPIQVHVEQRQVIVRWPDDLEVVPVANVFNVQATPDGIVVTIGQATQPLFTGSPEEQIRQARELTEVQATVVARFALTPMRATELAAALGQGIVGLQLAAAQTQTPPREVPAP